MSRQAWTLKKQNKEFNKLIYRKGLSVLSISILLNIALGLMIFYMYLHQPERAFYATSGIAFPVKLKSMATPNMSANPLLDPDPVVVEDTKIIPE